MLCSPFSGANSSGQIHMTIMCIFAVLTKQSGSALQENPAYVYRDRTVDTCRVASNARFSSLVRTSLESLSNFTYFISLSSGA